MDEQKKYQKELRKKKIAELRKIAGRFEPPIELKPSWTRDKISKLILHRRMDAERELNASQEKGVSHPSVFAQDRKEQQPVNPEFEQAVKVVDKPKKEKPGGVREGAGRPKGLTDEKAKVKNLPQLSSTPIRQGCQSLFDFWASAAHIEQLALSDDEAEKLSLPITQLQEFYFPGILPEIAGTWIMLIFAVSRIVKPRIDMVNVVRKQRKETRIKSGFEDRTTRHYQYTDNDGRLKPLHAVPAGEPAAYTDDMDKVTCPTCLEVIEKARP
jgi:hypothetical protein